MSDSPAPEERDQVLLDELRLLWSVTDPAPADLATTSIAAVAVDDLENDYAFLHLLSRRQELAGARGPDGPAAAATLQFGDAGMEVLLRVSAVEDATRRVDGWIAPAGPSLATLHDGTSQWRTPIDPAGRFEFPSLPHGSVRLWIHGGGPAFSTTMFEL